MIILHCEMINIIIIKFNSILFLQNNLLFDELLENVVCYNIIIFAFGNRPMMVTFNDIFYQIFNF